jgi:acyl carrier protein
VQSRPSFEDNFWIRDAATAQKSKMVTLDDLIEIIRRRLTIPVDRALDSAVPLKGFGLDSLSRVAIVLDIEESLGKPLPDQLLVPETFMTLDSLWARIEPLTRAESR